MFLKVHHRNKDGKDHRYYSLVEAVRTSRGPQHRTLAYLGELNGSTESAWRKSIAVFNGEETESQLELFASDSPVVPSGERVVQVVLDRVRWERPRDFGEVFLAQHLWRLLGLDELLEARMARGGEEIPWPVMAFILTAARLIAPSSELAIEERGCPLISHEVIVNLIGNTTTRTGLAIKAKLDRRRYPKGVKVSDDDPARLNLTPARFHGEWNYSLSPV